MFRIPEKFGCGSAAWLLAWSILLSGLVTSGAARAAPPAGYDFLSYDQALTRAAQQQKPVFLYFGRYGCSSCRKMHQEVFSDPELRARYSDHYVLAYVDTESGERLRLPNGERLTEMQFASRSRVLGTPTFFFIASDQKPLVKLIGFKTIEEMNSYDDYISGGHYRRQSLQEFLASR